MMKVLASVYACSPYDGSERAVGWNWVYELNKYHQLTVLTSGAYKKDIEKYRKLNSGELQNTKFIYLDVPNTSWHKGYHFERIYYIMWQKLAAEYAKELVKREKYDLVHHITYVTCVLPTYMYKCGIPFLLGPVAGGDIIPSKIKYPIGCKAKVFEGIRRVSQFYFTHTYNFRKMEKSADLILAATEDTAKLISQKYRDKIEIFQAVGLREDICFPAPNREKHEIPQFLMAGRMLYLKGYELGISAFVKALDSGLKAELTILGDTENNPAMEKYKARIMRMCGSHLGKEIRVVPKVEYNKMKEFYDQFDVLINCSLRDSGCFVVMEAMARGMAVISLDTGGPKVNTSEVTAVKIAPDYYEKLIETFTTAIIELGRDTNKQKLLGIAAREYALNNFLIERRTLKMNEYYVKAVGK